MIKTGEIECRIPSNGIKVETLFCTEPEGLRLDIWTVSGSLATALFTLGLLIAAGLTARIAIGTLRQMKQDSIAQSRPYVYAQVVPGLAGAGNWDLVIKNAGQSAARGLTATLSAWPEEEDIVTQPLRTMFTTPQTLPPGTQLRTYWLIKAPQGGYIQDAKTGATYSHHGIEQPATITFNYDDGSNPVRSYQDGYALNVNTIGLTPMATSGPELKSEVQDPSTKALYKILGYIVAQIGELRR